MKKMVTLSIAALMSTATLGMAAPAAAQNGYYDRDGYSDLQEYLNERNGVRDPLGVQHDPKTANAPEGQGYTNSDDDFWQLMIPVIINGALESAANQGR